MNPHLHHMPYEEDTKIRERPLAFVDLEFSGLGASHEIMQIGCVLVSQPDFKVLREWGVRVKPTHIESADPTALGLIGYSEEKWKDALPLPDALRQFNEVADSAVLIGYNFVWDFFFLKKSYTETGLVPAYHWQVLDVLPMAFAELYDSNLRGFRMREIVTSLKLKERPAHDALEDSRTTYEIFMYLEKHRAERSLHE